MRQRLWILFHLATLGVLGLLTVANIATLTRPFAASTSRPANGLLTAKVGSSGRSPATVSNEAPKNSHNPLKITQVGCEPNVRLRVVDSVRQVRLQFDGCADELNDRVKGIVNLTNGFEATLFGALGSESAAHPEHADTTEPMAGVFVSTSKANGRNKSPQTDKKTNRQIASEQISTDYISLVPGQNEIKIRRAGRDQTLRIERKP